MSDFTPSRTVWIVRDYRDVVNSMRNSFRNQAKQVKRIATDRDSDGWQGQGMSDATHELVRAHVHEDITDNSAAALIWYFRNQLFFDQGFDHDPRVLLVRYESLVTQPGPEFERIFAFLDLTYRPRHSRKVVPHSIRKAREPEIELPIRNLCEDMTRRFDDLRPMSGRTGFKRCRMRDLVVTLAVFGLLPLILWRPWLGILAWSWLGYMNPHRLAWGFATTMPFALMVAMATLVGLAGEQGAQAHPLDPGDNPAAGADRLDVHDHLFRPVCRPRPGSSGRRSGALC